jgi:hypothetical protein
MDAMTDRIRALERERDAYRRAKAENDARFQRERDDARAAEAAAVKRAEELQKIHDGLNANLRKLGNEEMADLVQAGLEISRLRVALSEAQAREGRYRQIVEMYLDDDCCVIGPDASCPTSTPCRYCVATAALSPPPVSALFPGVPLVPHEGPVTYEPKTTLPEIRGAAERIWPCKTCNEGYHDGCDVPGCPCTTCHPGAAAKEPGKDGAA